MFTAVFVTAPFLEAQVKDSKCENFATDSSLFDHYLTGEFYISPENYKGLQFLNKEWQLGDVILENNIRISHKYLNYHIITDHLFWLRESDYMKIELNMGLIKEFILTPNDNYPKRLFLKLNIKPIYMLDSVSRLLEVLAEGEFNLYAYRKAKILQNTNEVFPVTEYYYQYNKSKINYFISRRWILYSLVGDKKDVMKSVVRKNHLKIRKEEEMIKAIKLFNEAVNIPK